MKRSSYRFTGKIIGVEKRLGTNITGKIRFFLQLFAFFGNKDSLATSSLFFPLTLNPLNLKMSFNSSNFIFSI